MPAPRQLVVIGASAGGVAALSRVVADLPTDLPAAVLVVMHTGPESKSMLPEILERAGPLPAHHAVDGEPLVEGRIYVAPPDRHLLIRDRHARVVRGPRENWARPAIDPLFRSAALAYGRNVVAVILTGSLDDGAAGSSCVGLRGGRLVVQNPEEAVFPGMPQNAILADDPDEVLPVAEIGPAVVRLLQERSDVRREDAVRDQPPGDRSPFSCPACGGALFEAGDGEATVAETEQQARMIREVLLGRDGDPD